MNVRSRRASLATSLLCGLTVACGGAPTGAPDGEAVGNGRRPVHGGGAVAVSDIEGDCAELHGDAYEPVETRCDGIDNDCDGRVDALLLVDPQPCMAGPEACGPGRFACVDGEQVCVTRGPTPEVLDGADNDCNGQLDDVAAADLQARALLLAPRYVVEEGGAELRAIASFLEQRGIPYDQPSTDAGDAFDAALDALPAYPLAIVVGYLVDEYLTERRQRALEAYAAQGGTLVLFKPVFAPGSAAHDLTGTSSSERRFDVDEIVFDGAPALATSLFDGSEERSVPVNNQGSLDAITSAHVLVPRAPDTVALASARAQGVALGAVITRRSVGSGAVYALGHDLHRFYHARCYVNCFEPSGDLAGLFLQEVYREAMRGHVVLKHTVPGPEDSLVTISHDVDANDAQRAGEPWGEAGALQVARLEREHGVRGSFLITTDVATYYSPQLMAELCDLGMCPSGVHTVAHGHDFGRLPFGTCEETAESYAPPSERTLCGEVRVPIELLTAATGERPLAFRSPFLIVHPRLYEVLEAEGILLDSSYAVGDLKFNLPLSLARTAVNQHVFRRRALYSLPVALEDGIGRVIDGEPVREEMSRRNAERFLAIWTNAMLRNADNGSHTMALLHPSYGLGVPEDNLRHKLAVLDGFLAVCRERGVKVDMTMSELGQFWRAREQVEITARYAAATYSGSLGVGSYPVRDLTIEFGDAISEFACASCGAVEIRGKRVVLRGELAPESTHPFQAQAGVAPRPMR